jgi:hypothetical protein
MQPSYTQGDAQIGEYPFPLDASKPGIIIQTPAPEGKFNGDASCLVSLKGPIVVCLYLSNMKTSSPLPKTTVALAVWLALPGASYGAVVGGGQRASSTPFDPCIDRQRCVA